jgi:hypothetical protein
VSLITMTPQDGGMPMTTRTRRAEPLIGSRSDDLLAATGSGKA